MKIISWNIRGMCSSVKKRFVKNLIKAQRPDFLLIQETKLDQLNDFQIKRLWYESEVQVVVAEAEGLSGGLITLWNAQVFRAVEVIVNRRFILIKGVFSANFPCIILNVYAPNDMVARRSLWEEIMDLKARFTDSWCMGGDFNEILDIHERIGCTRVDRGMQDFQDFINNMELQNVPMIGRSFTWSNFQAHNIQSRLDRFLLAQEWLDNFGVTQWGMNRIISDHCPVMITNETKNWGPKPFRFLNAWLQHPKCMQIVKEEWKEENNQKWAVLLSCTS